MVFHISLDGGNGSFEWLIVGVFLVVTITLSLLARYEWRRARFAFEDRAQNNSVV
jgi:hypothetical protein